MLERPEAISIESICGGIDDSQPAEQYDGTQGVTKDFVSQHQAPVGQVQWNANLGTKYQHPGDVSGVRWGSGTLIGWDLFLTAGHLFDQTGGGWTRPLANGTSNVISPAEIARNMHVNFNYQVDPQGNMRTEQRFAITDLLEYRVGGLDYAIVRLEGVPGATFGQTGISTTDAAVGNMLCIIGHPNGLPKRVHSGPASAVHDQWVDYNTLDTLGGNSGSGILGPNGTI
ncbi:MAG: serine protease, partial [Actinobacteria bacterium]|nr:serine protease [Actinomycetota bacterium]